MHGRHLGILHAVHTAFGHHLSKQLLEELDTAFKEKQQTEQRFQKIEERFGAIGEKMDKILKLIETKP